MRYDIVLGGGAVREFRRLGAYERARVRDALERFLRNEPTRVSRSRIKRLRGMRQPQYRLRLGEIRVFYDVAETEVQILAIVSKDEVQSWLEQEGTPEA